MLLTVVEHERLLINEQESMLIKRAATKGHPSELEALQEKGRALTEYGMLLGLVIFCFFVFIKTFNLEQSVADIFGRVDSAITQLLKSNGDEARRAQ